MTTIVDKITLASSRDIPFNKLVLSQSNVRQVKSGSSIEELAESIARRGLIQSLHVRPVLDTEGRETGMFEVPAGGRRYRALELLVKQKRLNKTAPVPCVVGNAASGILIDEVSLVENIDRAPLHPLDQFRAFQAMRDKGMTEEAIAAAFFIGINVVKQRLRLAAVSPVLLDVYAQDGMTLEQLMAFTVTQDHERQQQVWDAIQNNWQKEPYQIRRMLTETTVRASDKRALFIGIDTYESAGGIVLRDLFQSDDGGWLQDVGLLDRLVAEKLEAEATMIATEGWKWVEAVISLPYGVAHSPKRLSGTSLEMNEQEQATYDALQAEYNVLSEQYDGAEELPDDVDQRLGEIETQMEALEKRPIRYDPADIAVAGVFVSIDHDGSLSINRGYVRPEDVPSVESDRSNKAILPDENREPIASAVQHGVVTIGADSAQTAEEEEDGIKPLPERLIIELTAHRTVALRDAVANHPHIAMTALLHKLVSDTFRHRPATGALEVNVRQITFPAQSDDLKDSIAAKSVSDRHERWDNRIPEEDDALWDWLIALDEGSRMDLLAHCISFGINALHERPNPYSGSGISEHGLRVRLTQTDRLARTTGLDMAKAGWRPTVGNYLGRVTKARILEAVREGAGERAVQLIDHMKKDDMAKEAERLLADSRWLPEPLRIVDAHPAEAVGEHVDQDGDEAALPAFLTDDAEDDEATEDDEQR